jgi:hypothetical protein
MYLYDEKRNKWVSHRDTTEYKQRKRHLRDYWTVGLLPLLLLTPPLQIMLLVFGVFASLSYLDETPYREL